VRSFLALEVPDPVTEYLRGVIERLAKMTHGVKWVKKEGIHITLEFLGEIEEETAAKLHQALLPIGSQFSRFMVSLKELDAFPSRRRARVVVVKLGKGEEEMKALFREVEERLEGFDFKREAREFTAHITIGRMRMPAPFPNGDAPAIEGMEFPLDALVLFKSTLTPAGALYTPIWQIKLGGEKYEGRSEQNKGT
jgi:2'-5' RNA ligase